MKRLRQFHCPAAWPPPWLAAVFAFLYIVLIVGLWLIGLGVPNLSIAIAEVPETAEIFGALLGAAAVFHALCRLPRFHPACNFAYASWLALSPWTAAKPLPLGPIHPVWQDAAVIAILSALARWHAHINPIVPLEAFGFAYLIGLTLLLAATATWPSFFAMGFLWPSLLLTDGKCAPVAAIFALAVIILWHGTWKSLRAFPWRQENRTHPGLAKPPKSIDQQLEMRIEWAGAAETSSSVGWPFAQLSPKARFKSVSTATSFWVSALIGWWAYCLIVGNGLESAPGVILAVGLVGALIRFGRYLSGLAPSFSFRSRVFYGRWIVPGFDQVFVTPLMAIIVGVIGGVVTELSCSWRDVAFAGFIALIWFILLAAGPTMRDWVLTGEHRFRPCVSVGASRQSFRPV